MFDNNIKAKRLPAHRCGLYGNSTTDYDKTSSAGLEQAESLKQPLLKNLKTLDSIPLFSSSLNRLMEIEDKGNLSTHELSSVILDDYGLINKVLQTVNAFYYNRLGREINTVTQAVILLGFNTIKKIALSMAVLDLMDHANGQEASKEIGKAFLAAHLAQDLGSKVPGIEPEETFISTLFRHLARIAMAIGNPQLLEEVRRLEKSSENADRLKARKIIRTLGIKLSDYWKLPKSLAGYLEGCASLSGSSRPVHRSLARDVSNFIRLYAESSSSNQFHDLQEKISKQYNVQGKSLEERLKKALDDTSNILPGFEKVISTGHGQPHAEHSALCRHPDQNTSASEEKDLSKVHLEREMLFTSLVQNLVVAVNNMETDLNQIYLLAIEILRRVLSTENIIFCKVSPGNRVFSACFGMGTQAGFLKRELSFDLKKGPPELKNAFTRSQEAIVKIKDLLPSKNGLPENLLSCPALLSPLVIDKRDIGCFILTKTDEEEFASGEIQKASIVRQLVTTATSLRTRKR